MTTEKQGHIAAARRAAHDEAPRQLDMMAPARIVAAHERARKDAFDTARSLGADLGAVEARVSKVWREAQAAWRDVEAIENDASLYRSAKQDRIAERVSTADAAVKAEVDAGFTEVAIMEARAKAIALPQMPPGAEDRARTDALMVLDRTAPERRADVFESLATRNDAIGALVTSEWGRDYLSAVEASTTAGKIHNAAIESAISAAASSGDASRAKAAELVRSLGKVRAIVATSSVPWQDARAILQHGS